MADSSAFLRLDPRIQHFLWRQGWSALRDVQERTIPLIIDADRDVLITAATASGKTEAAFLPALTRLLADDRPGLVVYVSPLKALINDQFGRLDLLCEDLGIPVWPWHGDVSSAAKAKFLRDPKGVLLITPESLEATFCNRGTAVAGIFEHGRYIIVDELHAFIGNERGKQLQSLMHRIETVLKQRLPRIGLSATLGDMQLAADFLRPGRGHDVALVEATVGEVNLRLLVKGFEEAAPLDPRGPMPDRAPRQIASHLFRTLRGSHNLVFPNSRREVERYTHLLKQLCEQSAVPNEFWPHHGSLSKEIRGDTETALKCKERPATAICTNTLELGIDIGAVKSVAQVGPPHSVASLRQRLGRSGRREGEAAILRAYCIEETLAGEVPLTTGLRLDTMQTTAIVSLLLENWFEPPVVHGHHLSTLVQQLLSYLAQNGGATAAEAYRLLCGDSAPFEEVSPDEFQTLLRHLGQQDLLMQDASGLLLHGATGEKLVNHYTFYAAFASDEEFRIVAEGRTLGTLPITQMLVTGQRLLFAGRTWVVDAVDESQKVIYVSAGRGGAPPLFNGGGGRLHTRICQRMRELYRRSDPIPFLDETAQRFVKEGRDTYRRLGLEERTLVDQGGHAMIFTWLGDDANEALACLLMSRNVKAMPVRLGVEIQKQSRTLDDLASLLADLATDEFPPPDVLLENARNLERQKWDWALPSDLLRKSYTSLCLDLENARRWLQTMAALRPNQFI